MTPSLRAGLDADIRACVDLWCSALEARDGRPCAPTTRGRAEGKLAAPRTAFVIAETPAGVIGFVLVSEPGSGFADDPPDAAYLSLLAVHPDHQGRGVGRLLLSAARAEAAAVADTMVLHVLVGNAGARALYSSAGWTAQGDPVAHPRSGAPMLTLVAPTGPEGLRAAERRR